MAILPVGIGAEEGGYQIERSLRFNSADSAYLNRTFGTPTTQNVFTFSAWLKRGKISAQTCLFGESASTSNGIYFDAADTLSLYFGSSIVLTTAAVFRDPSAWYHIVWTSNGSTQTIYVNGVSRASGTASQTRINSAIATYLMSQTSGSIPTDGYLAEVHFIDGSALDPTSFGEYNTDTGVWQPKAYTGSYGTNGFYLDFADNSSTTALGYDAAGSNDWTPNNFSVTAGAGNDSLVDTPTPYGTDTGVGGEVRGNYATANPLKKSSTATLTNGNLDVAHSSAGGEQPANFAVSSGKWYWEATPNSAYAAYGIILTSATPSASSIASGYHYYAGNGQFYTGTSGVSYGATFTNGDVIGVALDLDTNQITFYKNGTSQGAKSISAGEYYPDFASASTNTTNCNFGQRPFAYAAPSGFAALCTTNLPDPAIADGSTAMNAVLYTGNGSTQSITGVGFQPDWVWIKDRSNVRNHYLYDSVRGALKELYSNLTSAESTNTIGLSSFGSDGFTLNNGDNAWNGSGNSYVAWNWKAGGTGVSNTAGSITSTVSANTTAGFSIVTYTGTGANATVGHGLSSAPSFVVVKSRSLGTENWPVYHIGMNASPASGRLLLNLTNAFATNTAMWNNTAPTSSVFSIGTDSQTNTSAATYVAYCFAPVAGYSAFGSYTGNGSTDGPFVYTGHRPRWIMVKASSSAVSGWVIYDTVRSTYNVVTQRLFANSSAAEDTGLQFDILSNGFKVRETGGQGNDSGVTYIYAAFAENPFKYSLAR